MMIVKLLKQIWLGTFSFILLGAVIGWVFGHHTPFPGEATFFYWLIFIPFFSTSILLVVRAVYLDDSVKSSEPFVLPPKPEKQIASAVRISQSGILVRDSQGTLLCSLNCFPGEDVISVTGTTVTVGKGGHGRTYDVQGNVKGTF